MTKFFVTFKFIAFVDEIVDCREAVCTFEKFSPATRVARIHRLLQRATSRDAHRSYTSRSTYQNIFAAVFHSTRRHLIEVCVRNIYKYTPSGCAQYDISMYKY